MVVGSQNPDIREGPWGLQMGYYLPEEGGPLWSEEVRHKQQVRPQWRPCSQEGYVFPKVGTPRLGSFRVRVSILTLSLLSPVTLAINFPEVFFLICKVDELLQNKIKYSNEVVCKIISKIHPVTSKG